MLPAVIAAASQPHTVKVRLYPLHGSAERGTATIAQRGTDLIVTIDLTGAVHEAQFAHLHRGTCERVASPTMYELQPIRDGRSITRLPDLNLEMLLRGTYSILVHQTLSHASAHVACGTISGA